MNTQLANGNVIFLFPTNAVNAGWGWRGISSELKGLSFLVACLPLSPFPIWDHLNIKLRLQGIVGLVNYARESKEPNSSIQSIHLGGKTLLCTFTAFSETKEVEP